MKRNIKKIGIGCIMLVLVALLGVAAWLIFRGKAAEQVQTAKNKLDVEWYDANGKEFTISTVEELYEFGKLSYHYDFKGQTIKLGADIVVNEGDAADWIDVMPEREWESIYGFAGTFDGQGHTISGIYCNGFLYQTNKWRVMGTDHVTAGLFRNTQKECVIKNLKLVNSYFYSDLNSGVGSISSYGGGTFDSIYTDAIVISEKLYVGGIMGRATADTTITNCWFDGSVEVVGGYGRYTGGILGRADSNTKCKIEHCLNSGTMASDLYKRGVNMGGILGQSWESEVEMNDCLVSGTLQNDWIVVGSVVGNVGTESKLKMNDVYTITEAFDVLVGHIGGKLTGYPVDFGKELLTGMGGYQWTTLDFDKYWTVVEDGTPILQTFADKKVSVEGVAKNVDTSWYNEKESTYVLNDFADLYGFAIVSRLTDFADKTVKLGADITINSGKAADWAKEAPAYGWMPIGSTTLPFAGTFDGQKHTISGIYLKTDKQYSGLFGVAETKSTIKNVSLKNSYFETTANSFGSIAGRGKGVFDTVYSNAIVVSSAANAGGIIGQVPGKAAVKMNNCWFDGSVTNTANDRNLRSTGGLIGTILSDTKITNCLNSGTISAPNYKMTNSDKSTSVAPRIGGFVGSVGNKAIATISYSMNTGLIKVHDAATSGHGSIVGSSNSMTKVSNTFATSESCDKTVMGTYEGQVIVYSEKQLSGYGGYQWTTLDFNKYWSVVADDTSILKSFAGKVPSLNGVARMVDTSWYNEKDKTFILNDVADLYGFSLLAYSEDFKGKTVKLGADITVNTGNAADWGKNAPAYEWISIGTNVLPFEGTFDGQMHTISGLYLKTDAAYGGLFGVAGISSTLKNFSLENSYFESSVASFGSVAGRGRGTFDTIYSNAIVVGNAANIGGMIGQVPGVGNVVMNNCWFDGTVTNHSNDKDNRGTGGLIGIALSDVKVSNCLNTGTIDASAYTVTNSAQSTSVAPRLGGLIGCVDNKSTATISHSMNAGLIKQSSAATSGYGSIVGSSNSTTKVSDVYATSESCKNTAVGTVKGDVVVYSEDKLSGYGGYQWTTLDFDKYWSVVVNDTSVLKAFATDVPSLAGVARLLDISWYDESKSSYTLYDMQDLYGLAMLSTTRTDFAGKTITIADEVAKIAVNDTSNVDDWSATNAPANEWESIGSVDLPFAGTFDGNGATISGLYMNTDKAYSGFFGVLAETAKIKDFSLTNSYFYSTANALGSVVALARGTMDSIYSDAIVVGSKLYIGGMVSSVPTTGEFTMNNCWFAGSVTNTGNSNDARCTGGLISRVSSDTKITNCLNTGAVSAPNYAAPEGANTGTRRPYVGGLVGYLTDQATLTIENSLNTGNVTYNEAATTGFGSILGRTNAGATATSVNTYATNESCPGNITTTQSGGTSDLNTSVIKVAEQDITGTKAMKTIVNLFAIKNSKGAYEHNWLAVPGKAPALAIFEEHAGEKAVALDTSWYTADGGTESKPYKIADVSDFFGMAVLSYMSDVKGYEHKYFVLENSLDLNKNATNNAKDWSATVSPDYEWIGIGTEANKFAGIFEGNNKTISGVYMNATESGVGLFNYSNSYSDIKNLSLLNSYIATTKGAAGSIVGHGDADFDTIYSDAIVSGGTCWIGGFVGRTNTAYGAKMNNCWFDGSVSQVGTGNSGEKAAVGGLIGLSHRGATVLTNCLNTGSVSATYTADATPYVGGLIGKINQQTVVIRNCFDTGMITVVDSATSKYGPIVGGKLDAATLTISTTYSLTERYTSESTSWSGVTKREEAKIKGTDALSVMAGLFSTENTDGSYSSYWSVVPGKNPVLTSFANYASEKSLAVDASWYKAGAGTSANPYKIADASDLYGMMVLSRKSAIGSFTGKVFRLEKDITFNEGNSSDWSATVAPDYKWSCIGESSIPFAGEFDGNNKVISGMYVYDTDGYCGLFSYTADGANVHHFGLKNSYVGSVGATIGSIVGRAQGGTFNAIYSNAIVVGNNQNIGGLIGQHQRNKGAMTMMNCWFDGSVTNNYANANSNTGGLIGSTFSPIVITSCLVTGDVTGASTADNPAVGGLIGASDTASITISYSLGAANMSFNSSATKGIGSIAGWMPSGKIDNCNATTKPIARGTGATYVCGIKTAAEIKSNPTENAKYVFLSSNPNPWMVVDGEFPIPKALEFVRDKK